MLRLAKGCLRLFLACLLLTFQVVASVHAAQTPDDLGTVELVSILGEGGEPFPGTAFTLVRERSQATPRHSTSITSEGLFDQVRFTLPAGRYRALARNGTANVERTITVRAGETDVYRLNLSAGQVKLSLVEAPDGQLLHGTRFKIWRVAQNKLGDCRKLMASEDHATTATFTLPAGSYVAIATNSTHYGEVPFRIRPRQAEAIKIVANRNAQIAKAENR